MEPLHAEQFKNDPRIKQAKELLHQALLDHQRHITAPVKSCEVMTAQYKQRLDRAGQLRGRELFFPYLGSGLGHGALVELADGSVKYDFITGIGVHYMGHSHPMVMEACVDAALEDTLMQGNLQANRISLEVMETLVQLARAKKAGLRHCFLTTSGAMANENAFKIIFQRQHPAHRLLAFSKCFTGRSMATSQMTDKPQYREGLPKVLEVDYIPFFDPMDPAGSARRAVELLNSLLEKNKDQYAGMCFELVQGEGGFYPGSGDFFKTLMKVLKENHVAVMVDEVQTFGRTQELFAFQYFGLDEWVDVVTIGKMTQVCATFFTEEFNPRPGLLSQTFTGASASLHACKAILEEMVGNDYLGPDGKIARYSNHFRKRIEELSFKYPQDIHGPFGFGAMVGFTYRDGAAQVTKNFLTRLFEAGVIAFSAGSDPVRIRFLMPVGAVTFEDIDAVCSILEDTLKFFRTP